MYPPKDWINKSNYKVKQILEEVRESMPITLPIPIIEVVKLYLPDVQILKSKYPLLTGVSACATHDMLDGWIILITGNEPETRQRFSLAHELGHIALMPNTAQMVYCGRGNDWELLRMTMTRNIRNITIRYKS